jgi:hypothetical protein
LTTRATPGTGARDALDGVALGLEAHAAAQRDGPVAGVDVGVGDVEQVRVGQGVDDGRLGVGVRAPVDSHHPHPELVVDVPHAGDAGGRAGGLVPLQEAADRPAQEDVAVECLHRDLVGVHQRTAGEPSTTARWRSRSFTTFLSVDA